MCGQTCTVDEVERQPALFTALRAARLFVTILLHNLEPFTKRVKQPIALQGFGCFSCDLLRDVRLGEVLGEIADNVLLRDLFDVDALASGTLFPEREEFRITHIIRMNNDMQMSVPVPRATGNFNDVSPAKYMALPESALAQTAKRSHDMTEHFREVGFICDCQS
ncbi:hypothetical protein ES703_69794 [subsurface metagenome]